MCTLKITRLILTLIFAVLLLGTNSFAPHEHNSMHHSDMKMKMESDVKKIDSSIVRTGTIDLKKIDVNKDGKVYQDQMDWNVISDKPGKCPLCKMTLQEVTLKRAKENLKKYKFEVK